MGRMVALLALLAMTGSRAAVDENVAELLAQRSRSRDSVIPLTEDLLREAVVGRNRPYTVVIFFSAQQVLESNPTLRMLELRKEYGMAAKAFSAGPDADKMFFFEAALETSQAPFQMMQVSSLPFVARIPPGMAVSGKGALELSRTEKMMSDTVSTKDYPWPAETFLTFLAANHGLKAAPVVRPSIYRSPLFPFVVLGVLVTAAYVAYKAYTANIFRHTFIWATLSLAVYWFSASGGMFNIIRGMPFFIRDRNGNLQFFLTGRQGQLGAEGFMLGSLYLLVSCSLAFVTTVAPRISSTPLRGACSLLGAVLAAGGMYQTFALWTLKTGYKHVFYL